MQDVYIIHLFGCTFFFPQHFVGPMLLTLTKRNGGNSFLLIFLWNALLH